MTISPRQAVEQASTRSRAIKPDSASRRTAASVQLTRLSPKRLELAGDLRPVRPEEKGINEPAAVRIVAAKGVLSVDHPLEAPNRIVHGRDNLPQRRHQIRERDRQQGLGQTFLASEVVVQRGLGNSRRLDNLSDRRGVVTLLCK